jgi:hypothetical protein
MKGHEKDQPTHLPCNVKVQIAIPKKRKKVNVTFPNYYKRNETS